MSMQDPIADMLTRIRNAQSVAKNEVSMPMSKIKHSIAKVLEEEGYISGLSISEEAGKKDLVIELKYYQGEPVIGSLKRVSRPGLRVYKSKDDLPRIQNGLGMAIISTSKGLMSDKKARKLGIGGELICYLED